jgi:phage tail tape-measure protein
MDDRLLSIEKNFANRVQPVISNEQSAKENVSITRRQGIVSSIDLSNNRCTVNVGGIDLPSIRFQRQVTLGVGDTVWVELAGNDPHVIGHLGYPNWTNITLSAGATNAGGVYNLCSWTVMPGGFIAVRGTIVLGAAGVGAVFGNIPSGFRPINQNVFRIIHYNGTTFLAGIMEVLTNGDLKATVGTNSQFFYIDSCVYSLF